ncbi:MAG: MotA/TolQ/ExbB proton channel family protein [Bacteroidales bacterium]|nr:MotA/TolQ/ExbB proton channel family protein [Bacteroidales bacterium]
MRRALIILVQIILFTGAISIRPVAGQENIVPDAIVEEYAEQDNLQDELPASSAIITEETLPQLTVHQQIKRKFIEGGAGFMAVILLCFIFGLAIAIERIIYLNLSVTNTKKLLEDIETSIEGQGIDAAKEVCRNTRGPVASIFFQGLDRFDHGLEIVEKSILSYGSVQMGLLEKNLSWISLFIALAPMLGFMGTVIGMIMAFDVINTAGDVTPQLVAGPIGVALITTAAGLIVGAILQVFYSYLLSKIDSIVNTMEDASISFIDILIKFKLKK